MKQRYQ